MNIWKVILATIVIFGAGVFTGGLLVNCIDHSHHKSAHPTQPVAEVKPQNSGRDTNRVQSPQQIRSRPPDMFGQNGKEFMQKLDEVLQLTPEQHDIIEKIVADGQRRNSEIWSNAMPQMRAIMTETRQHVREQLTPDQQKQFEELMKRPPRRPPNSTNAAASLPTSLLSGSNLSPEAQAILKEAQRLKDQQGTNPPSHILLLPPTTLTH